MNLIEDVKLGLIALLAGVLIVLGVQDWSRGKTIKTMTATASALQIRIDTATDANELQQKTIGELRDANAANTASEAQAKLKAEAALAQVGAMLDQVETAAALSRQRSETIYANDPDCTAWGARPVCPAIAVELRKRADL